MTPPSLNDQNYDLAADLRTRIVNLEHWRTQRDIADARAEEQKKHMDMRFDQLESKIKAINDLQFKLAWIIIGGFLSAIVAYTLKGGFGITLGG